MKEEVVLVDLLAEVLVVDLLAEVHQDLHQDLRPEVRQEVHQDLVVLGVLVASSPLLVKAMIMMVLLIEIQGISGGFLLFLKKHTHHQAYRPYLVER